MNFLRQFHDIVSDQNLAFDDKTQKLLNFGLKVFGLDLAIISEVQERIYTVLYAVTPDNGLAIGTQFNLNDTYCVHTLNAGSALAFHNVSQSEIADHPCFTNFQLESYIGAPIKVGNEVFGTVNFSSANQSPVFTDQAYDYIELFAQWLGAEFARNQTKDRLTKNSNSLLKLESVANIGTWEVDIAHNKIYWSKQTKLIHEVDENYQPMMETAINFYKEGSSRENITKAVELAVGKGEKWNLELEIVTANNNNIWVSTFGEAEFEGDTCVRLFGTFQDITESMRLREELKSKKAEAERLLFDRSMLFAKISHELRTPLNGITGMLTNLIDEHDPENRTEKIKVALRSSDILLNIINEVLDFSKINHGELKLEPNNVLLKTVFTDLVSLYTPLFTEKRVALEVKNEINDDCWAFFDNTRLSQITSNLLSNALKFTEQGIVKLDTFLTNTDGDLSLTITVTDSGRGMTPEFLKSLFSPFTQEVDSKNTKGGTGLGLAIVKELVQYMGGQIEVSSEINKGSTFSVYIPITRGEEQILEDKPLANINIDTNELSVLVVDDNDINRLVLNASLNKLDINPDFAVDGQDAVLKCKQKPYDLIFMDCIMPILDGFEATKQLREQNICPTNKTYIVALTANTSSQDKLACKQAGMDLFISKPFKMYSLESAIASAIKTVKPNLSLIR
ncbi:MULTISPECIES: GAF domain-containing hybrid sensor histidine kinase/response regulator [unclassified Pseudoalteromonas]|uniref:hybrid sensor histidine kinase/response regulator n=1 Tax=unclassified Pseudoalteromonas TaxID=194690 RepID=UPI00072FB66E|nr:MULTISPECIES: GAF domain-containing hybrid sensor histidine kinase/response regulator [unclassified Pseudoalteromonas]KTD97048.1 hybrid sensor histidine kinase/response regulator [Pseudoalteromonas sp. H71]MBW4965873.1 response regulator [Pseudoalteromonas sp. CR1]TMN84171.1 hybrid sensor histidine kinase/response regulator [Pseudoalteromonas sp. S410]TMN90587.1 hybrid sensor histidine kinase/response regulator [Pseudoalteromonas sp. S408]TMN95287.1 hybrid sensor histidine kinase/response r